MHALRSWGLQQLALHLAAVLRRQAAAVGRQGRLRPRQHSRALGGLAVVVASLRLLDCLVQLLQQVVVVVAPAAEAAAVLQLC